jgi:DNA-damage-inducible protein D
MKTEQIHSLTETFEAHAQQTESGVEYWLARDLQHLLGYAKRLEEGILKILKEVTA